MPFVQRVVQPVQLSRVLLHDEQGRPRVKDGELEAVTNHTLSSALRQLASVVLLADEIFQDLGKILGDVTERSKRLRVRIAAVDERVSHFDPKAVTVPESDLTIFSSRKEHFEGKQCVDKALFTADSRPVALRRLYEAAAPTPLPVVRQLDRYRRDGLRSSRFFAVTPVLAGKRRARPTRANDIDIETRTPAVVSRLRMWTSLEALGDVTVDPDCTHKIDATADNDDVDHRLPSPEEQVQAIALKFPAEIVKVDVSGRSFSRMSAFRRSLMHVECDATRRRGNKSRRGRSKRRNTIAGTDTKELAAIVCDSSDTNFGKSTPESVPSGATISEKKSHLESLKEWGRSRLRLIKNSEPAVRLRERSLSSRRKWGGDGEPQPHSSSGNWSASSESGHSTATSTSHHPRSSISSGSVCQKHGGGRRNVMVSTSSSVTSESTLTPDDGETCSMYSCDTEGYYTSFHLDSGLKTLREEEGPMPALRSTSALSAHNSSTLTADSEYELFGKGSTSTTASSAGTVCTTLIIPPPSVPERVNSHLSTERNVKSLTNLTSDKTPPLNKESAYYRTDNKSNTDPCRGRSVSELKKVEPVKSNLTKENVSKLKEQYSDNVVQADKNCMIMVEVHHESEDDKNEKCGDSPDSGHNTCSSPVDSVTSPSLDLEMSECSDLEGVDRVERIRVKTTINSSRIPSMCVITPPQSDDEVSLSAMKTAVDIGDYVTIADVRNPATANPPVQTPVPNSPVLTRDTEYVSLNELPTNDSLERKRRQGARVTLDSEGKVVYSSDSLRRRKAIHTTGTFDPGPNIATSSSPVMQHRVMNIRPVVTSNSPILRGDRRLASASLTPTTQKIISASQQIISRPLSPLVGNKKIIVTESTTSTLLSKTDTLEKVDNKTVLPNNQTGLVTLAAQRRTSPSNQKQYFPKSAYGNMSPVATSNRPMSPLVLANNPKITNISNGRRSQTPPTSPVKSPTLSSRPLSPKNVVKANLNRAVSPTSPRGAYVRVKDATGSDEDSKMLKRSDSYRMANDDTKTVFNPNVLGRKQYGAGIVAGPKLLTAIQTVQTNKGKQGNTDIW